MINQDTIQSVWHAEVMNTITHIRQQYVPLNTVDDLDEMIGRLFDEMGVEENLREDFTA